MFNAAVEAAAKAHAIAEYPKEACGVVTGTAADATYVALPNIAADPEEFFELPARTLIDHAPVLAVVHSHCHPRHQPFPTAADMRAQIEAALPFGIVWTNGETAGAPLWFGDFLLDVPLFDSRGAHIQREFAPGVNDCYSLLRTWFWQIKKVKLPEFPRDIEWWKNGGDLYREGFAKAGFVAIDAGAAKPGDGVLMKWGHWSAPFHAGVLLDGGLILHHLQQRLSRREPFARWAAKATHYLRYAEHDR